MSVHRHKCGFRLNHEGNEGCGFLWSHDSVDMQKLSARDYADAHQCPRCGIENRWIFAPHTIAVWMAEQPEER